MTWGLESVSVSFGHTAALEDVSVAADRGGITAVVGGDGAGKSTCLRSLVGLVRPDRGTIRTPAKERVGYVPATAGLYADLSIVENIDFVAHAHRLAGRALHQSVADMLDRTGLAGVGHRLGGQLSGGMQRKLAVGLALLPHPDLLVLDEPTTGVDPVSRSGLWRLVTAAAARGTAVVVSTTYLNEAARASSVVVLHAGTVMADGSPADILRSVPGRLGTTGDGAHPSGPAWRRGRTWRVWAPGGELPEGSAPVSPDFEDAVVVAELAGAGEGTSA